MELSVYTFYVIQALYRVAFITHMHYFVTFALYNFSVLFKKFACHGKYMSLKMVEISLFEAAYRLLFLFVFYF